MITGISEGYVTDEVTTHDVKMPTQTSALLFIALCVGVDEAREESYRYGYGMEKFGKLGHKVIVSDVGE